MYGYIYKYAFEFESVKNVCCGYCYYCCLSVFCFILRCVVVVVFGGRV